MESIPEYYTVLFNAATDAIEALEQPNAKSAERAKLILIKGQQMAEEKYLEANP